MYSFTSLNIFIFTKKFYAKALGIKRETEQ